MNSSSAKPDFESDRYRSISRIGQGGMGTVYKCEDTNMMRTVALKLLKASNSATIAARFQIEAKAAAQLNHPNIVKVLDFGQLEDGQLFLAMEYLEGDSLESLVRLSGGLGLRRSIPILVQICSALDTSHRTGIIHRDVKPSNVMIIKSERGDDIAKVLDFGTAKLKEQKDQSLTATGAAIGSPTYMSPEATEGKELTTASDIYSFGCLMFETLTGERPFVSNSSLMTMSMHLNDPAPRMSDKSDKVFSDELEEIVEICLEKSPEDRFQTFAELQELLIEIEESELIPLYETGIRQKMLKDRTLINLFKVLSTVLLVGVIFMAALVIYQNIDMFFEKKRTKPAEFEERTKDLKSIGTKKPELKKRGKKSFFIPVNLKSKKESIKFLKNRSDVKDLQFRIDNVRGDTLEEVSKLDLETLVLWACDIDDDTLGYVSKIKTLERLSLWGCSGQSNDGISKLSVLSKISYLSLDQTGINNSALNNLTSLKNLEILELNRTPNLTSKALLYLGKFPKLNKLDISESAIENGSLNDLVKIKSLRSLTIGKIPEDFSKTLNRTKIETLTICQSSDLTDNELLVLASATRLKNITIDNCPKISKNLLPKFQKANSKCQLNIIYNSTNGQDFLKNISGIE